MAIRKVLRIVFVLGLLLTLGLAACAPAETATPEPPAEEPEPTAEPEEPMAEPTAEPTVEAMPEPEQITLLMWDQFGDEDGGLQVQEMIDSFEADHPNVTVEREVMTGEIMEQTLNPVLGSGTGPDVFYAGAGYSRGGVLSEAGLILPLDEFADQLGWNDRVFQWALEIGSWDGHQWSLGHEMEFLAIYYNKTLLEEEGLEMPETDEEMLEFCATASDRGYVPVAFGNKPGWPSYHQYAMVVNNALGAGDAASLLIDNQGTWDTPELANAVEFFFVDMRQAGCFPPDLNAIEY